MRKQVGLWIREMILRGEFAAGSKLRQLPLAHHFGVAQGVIREALLELELHGWVRTVDRLGAFVTQIDAATRAQAMEIRAMHEALAARLCCERATRADIRELAHIAERAYEAAASGGANANANANASASASAGDGCREVEAAALDRQFHARLIQLSGNDLLAQLSENYRFRAAGPAVTRDRSIIRAEHLAILRAIQDGRADDVERLVREHIAADAG